MVLKKSRTIKSVRWASALFLLISAVNVYADVKLLDSFPKSDTKLGESVTDLRLWFDVEPDPARSKVELLYEDVRIPVVALHTMGENDLMGFKVLRHRPDVTGCFGRPAVARIKSIPV